MKNKIFKTLVNILKEILSIVYIIIEVIFIFATLGLAIILFDSVNKSEYKDDWELMEEWKQKEKKKNKKKGEKMKIAEYLIWFFGIIFVLNWFAMWFVLPEIGEIPFKISAILFVVLSVICFILASILAKGERNKK